MLLISHSLAALAISEDDGPVEALRICFKTLYSCCPKQEWSQKHNDTNSIHPELESQLLVVLP